MLCTNLVVKQLYTDVQLLNSLFQKAYGKGIILAAIAINARVSNIRLRFIFVRVLYVQVKAPCSLQTKLVLCRRKCLCV